MSTPQVKAPARKAFHLPKSAEGEDKASAKAEVGTAKKAAAPQTKARTKTLAKTPTKTKTKTGFPAASADTTTKTPARKTPGRKSAQAPAAEAEAEVKKNAGKTSSRPEAKTKHVKKEKVVRDSFTMPKSDYAKIASLKVKCQKNGVHVKKSELLRAALALLDAAPEKRLIRVIKALETVKTGRPANA
jgi:hypothetical protein